jgi:DNA polymerase-1
MNFPSLTDLIIGLDTETTGLRPYLGDTAFGISLAFEGWSGYFDIRRTPEVIPWLQDELPKAQLIIGHHWKFDWHFMNKLGIEYLDVPCHCTMITDTLIYEHHLKYGLEDVAQRRLGIGKSSEMIDKWKEMSGAKSKSQAMSTLKDAPFELVSPYAIRDAELLLPIYHSQWVDIKEQNLERVYRLEMDLLPVLADMERGGVHCDVEAAHASIPKLTEIINSNQILLNNIVGFNMNVNSTPQVRKVFAPEKIGKWQFKLLDGTLCWATGAGNPSIDQNVLKEMTHPAAALIRRVRKDTKLRDTFVSGHILSNIDERGYVHTTFNSTRNDADAGTVTGRLSSTEPAMQQINGRDKDTASVIRAMFIPDDGDDWLGADYSSADFRIAAHYLNDSQMIAAYNEKPDTDFHGFVAEMIGIPRSPRFAGDPNAKTLNLSMAFGAGAGKTAMQLGMPFSVEEWGDGRMKLVAGQEAQAVLNTYHNKFPAFKAFSKQATAVAKDRGYIRSLMGRKLRFVNNDAHKAAGYLFQSGCAEAMKTKLVEVWRLLRGTPYRLFLTVHDELAISAPRNGTMDKEIHSVFTDFQSDNAPFKLRVPMTASFNRGANWYEAK